MDQSLAGNRAGMAAAIGLLAGVLIGLAALLDAGPFSDELGRAEYIARGDEICEAAHARFRELQDEPPRTAADARSLTDELIETAEEELDAVSGLDPPQALEDATERYVEARARGISLMDEGLAAARDGEARDYAAAQARLAANQLDRFSLARRIGFRECSKPLVSRRELKRQAKQPAASDLDAPPIVDNPET